MALGKIENWLQQGMDDGLGPIPTSEPGGPDGPDSGSPGDEGSLQVVEPPPSFGLLDTIVGGVVAPYLGS